MEEKNEETDSYLVGSRSAHCCCFLRKEGSYNHNTCSNHHNDNYCSSSCRNRGSEGYKAGYICPC